MSVYHAQGITEVMQRKKKNRFSSCHQRMITYNLGQKEGPRHECKWQSEKSKMLFKTQTKGNHICLLKRKHNSYLWRDQALNFSFPSLETDEGRRRERQMFQSLSQTFHTFVFSTREWRGAREMEKVPNLKERNQVMW